MTKTTVPNYKKIKMSKLTKAKVLASMSMKVLARFCIKRKLIRLRRVMGKLSKMLILLLVKIRTRRIVGLLSGLLPPRILS